MNNISIALLGHGSFAEPSFEKLRQEFQIVDASKADCLVVANYGSILTKEELSKPKYGAINIHGSLLPNYRGASPIQTAIANGETKTGITFIKMDEEVDHGPMLSNHEVNILSDDTTESLRKKMGIEASKHIVSVLNGYFNGSIVPQVQDHSKATFTKKLNRQDSMLSLAMSDEQLYNRVRAYGDEPGAFLVLQDRTELKVLTATLVNGKFTPLIVQKPGKKPISYSDFLRGYRHPQPF